MGQNLLADEPRRSLFSAWRLGLIGASLFYGDSMITPAISVLSAVEGLELAFAGLDRWVVPLALIVLIALFLIQRRGTATLGKLFGPG